MSQPEKTKVDKSMMWMGIAMVACCAIPITVSLLAGGSLGFLFGRSNVQPIITQPTNQTSNSPQFQKVANKVTLTPAQNWQTDNHIHGLTVSPENPNIIYAASHNGLLQRSESGQWFWVGKDRSDYMGFTGDRTNGQRFYSSGHPSTGGNLGFRVTDNGGEEWKFISMEGVDFHVLGISPSNPQVFYGWASSGAKGLFVSADGGKNWTQPRITGLSDAPFDLVVDPEKPNRVFATTRSGIYESVNRGDDWTAITNMQTAPVIALNLVKQGDRTIMYGYRFEEANAGIYRSNDDGKNWEKLWTETGGVIVKLAVAPSNSQILYAANEKNQVFQSQDSGKTWKTLT
jgi:photosystem II stability/assembly factor-like uncharacterized protein